MQVIDCIIVHTYFSSDYKRLKETAGFYINYMHMAVDQNTPNEKTRRIERLHGATVLKMISSLD